MCCLGPNPRFYACWLSLLPTDQLTGCYKRQGRRELEKQSQFVCIGKAFISASPEPLLSVIHPIGRKLGHRYLFQLELHLFYSSNITAKGVLPTLRLVYVPFYLSPESSKAPIQHRTMSVFLDLSIWCMLTWLPALPRCLWAFYIETTLTHFSLYPLVCWRLRPSWHRRKCIFVKSTWPNPHSSILQLLISFHLFLFYSSFSKELNSRASASDLVSMGWFTVWSKTSVSISPTTCYMQLWNKKQRGSMMLN